MFCRTAFQRGAARQKGLVFQLALPAFVDLAGDGEKFWGTAKARQDFSQSIEADSIEGPGQVCENCLQTHVLFSAFLLYLLQACSCVPILKHRHPPPPPPAPHLFCVLFSTADFGIQHGSFLEHVLSCCPQVVLTGSKLKTTSFYVTPLASRLKAPASRPD